jgi:hypothetical protein
MVNSIITERYHLDANSHLVYQEHLSEFSIPNLVRILVVSGAWEEVAKRHHPLLYLTAASAALLHHVCQS